MEVQDILERARDTLTVKRVFGEPFQQDGLTVIPAARIVGGTGAGSGEDPAGNEGGGGGFGLIARPVGAFVIKDGDLEWRPAVDVTRVVIGAQLVAITALLVVRSVVKSRAKSRR